MASSGSESAPGQSPGMRPSLVSGMSAVTLFFE